MIKLGGKQMSSKPVTKQDEQKRMDMVVDKIKVATAANQKKIAAVERDKENMQADFNKNLRINTSTYSGMMDTAMTIRQQQQALAERENAWQSATRELGMLQKMEHKPYFARIDLQEAGEDKTEAIYIGLGSFADSPDHFLIYDWRAPISSVYYDGQLGHVTYNSPMGKQEANLKLKRQFVVEDGKIITLFDTDETVGDQMLLDVLGDASDTKMKSIVTTIQREQNKIIRDTKSDLLFVQGAAGSGKTSAVLQRVAFLLYRYRGNLTSSQIILFSPNQLFNDYIDQVLPELGEHNMVQMTYYQYTQRRLPKLKVETLAQRFAEADDRQARRLQALKDSLRMFKATSNYAKYLNHKGVRFRDLKFQGKTYFSKEEISAIYYGFNESYSLRNRLEGTVNKLLHKLQSQIGRLAKTDEVEKAIQDLSQEQLNALYGDHPKDAGNGTAELSFLAKRYVQKQLQPLRRAILKGWFFNVSGQFIHFLRHVPDLVNLNDYGVTPAEWQLDVDATIAAIKAGQMAMSNVTPYLYLYDLITGKRGDTKMRHVFIDEIQDYSAYQLAYLKFRFPRAKFTMLGDLNQAIFTGENSHSLLKELSTMFAPEKTQVVQLTKSYRSTQQITDFSREVLINGEKVTAFARNGAVPTITVAKSSDQLLAGVIRQVHQNEAAKMTTAIIGKTLTECQELTKKLKAHKLPVTLIKTENQRLVPGTIVVPAYLAKGLEFDAVIVWNANRKNYHFESERQLVYTICSRAMHQLDIFAVGELTPLMDSIDPELYELRYIQ